MGALSKYLQKNIPTLKPRVTCLLLKNNRVLLGQKKEGIGRGNYISIGGKPIRGESLVQAARREVQEEIGVLIEDVYRVADLEFYFTKTKDDSGWILLDCGNFIIHIMNQEKRAFYELEKLCFPGPEVSYSSKSS